MKHEHPLYEQWEQCFECNIDRFYLKKCDFEDLEKEIAIRIENTGQSPIVPALEIEGEDLYANKDNKIVRRVVEVHEI